VARKSLEEPQKAVRRAKKRPRGEQITSKKKKKPPDCGFNQKKGKNKVKVAKNIGRFDGATSNTVGESFNSGLELLKKRGGT